MVILGMQFPPQYYQQMRVAQAMPDDVNGMQRQHPAVMMDPRMAQVIKFLNNIACISSCDIIICNKYFIREAKGIFEIDNHEKFGINVSGEINRDRMFSRSPKMAQWKQGYAHFCARYFFCRRLILFDKLFLTVLR